MERGELDVPISPQLKCFLQKWDCVLSFLLCDTFSPLGRQAWITGTTRHFCSWGSHRASFFGPTDGSCMQQNAFWGHKECQSFCLTFFSNSLPKLACGHKMLYSDVIVFTSSINTQKVRDGHTCANKSIYQRN